MGKVEQFTKNMENLCNDNSHGYNKDNRWGPDYDCSSSVITSLKQAGFDVGEASYTGNMSSNLCARGWQRLSPSITKKRGDILLNDADHCAVYCGNNLLAEFSQSETGGDTGQPGDSAENNTNIQVYNANGTDAQLYKFNKVNDGLASYYTIEPKAAPGKYLSVENDGINANNVKIYENLNNSKQRFWIREESDGYYMIVHIFTLECLSAQD